MRNNNYRNNNYRNNGYYYYSNRESWFEAHKVGLAIVAILLVFAMVFFVPWLMMKIRHGDDAFSFEMAGTTTAPTSAASSIPQLIPATLTGTAPATDPLSVITTTPAVTTQLGQAPQVTTQLGQAPTTQTTAFAANPYGYVLVVYKGNQTVAAYALTEEGIYNPNEPAKMMLCSTGSTQDETPNGSYKVLNKYDYRALVGGRAQYCTRFDESLMFESVPVTSSAMTQQEAVSQMLVAEYRKLGQAVSGGDIRLCVGDAKWIFDYCELNTGVIITDRSCPTGSGVNPPALLEGEPYQKDGLGWDPTDPDTRNPYAAVYTMQGPTQVVTVPTTTAAIAPMSTTPAANPGLPNGLSNLLNQNPTQNNSGLSLWTHELTLKVGNVVGLNVASVPAGASEADLQWYVDGNAIYFGNNTIVAIQPGRSNIVVMWQGIIDTCTVTVIQ